MQSSSSLHIVSNVMKNLSIGWLIHFIFMIIFKKEIIFKILTKNLETKHQTLSHLVHLGPGNLIDGTERKKKGQTHGHGYGKLDLGGS